MDGCTVASCGCGWMQANAGPGSVDGGIDVDYRTYVLELVSKTIIKNLVYVVLTCFL